MQRRLRILRYSISDSSYPRTLKYYGHLLNQVAKAPHFIRNAVYKFQHPNHKSNLESVNQWYEKVKNVPLPDLLRSASDCEKIRYLLEKMPPEDVIQATDGQWRAFNRIFMYEGMISEFDELLKSDEAADEDVFSIIDELIPTCTWYDVETRAELFVMKHYLETSEFRSSTITWDDVETPSLLFSWLYSKFLSVLPATQFIEGLKDSHNRFDGREVPTGPPPPQKPKQKFRLPPSFAEQFVERVCFDASRRVYGQYTNMFNDWCDSDEPLVFDEVFSPDERDEPVARYMAWQKIAKSKKSKRAYSEEFFYVPAASPDDKSINSLRDSLSTLLGFSLPPDKSLILRWSDMRDLMFDKESTVHYFHGETVRTELKRVFGIDLDPAQDPFYFAVELSFNSTFSMLNSALDKVTSGNSYNNKTRMDELKKLIDKFDSTNISEIYSPLLQKFQAMEDELWKVHEAMQCAYKSDWNGRFDDKASYHKIVSEMNNAVRSHSELHDRCKTLNIVPRPPSLLTRQQVGEQYAHIKEKMGADKLDRLDQARDRLLKYIEDNGEEPILIGMPPPTYYDYFLYDNEKPEVNFSTWLSVHQKKIYENLQSGRLPIEPPLLKQKSAFKDGAFKNATFATQIDLGLRRLYKELNELKRQVDEQYGAGNNNQNSRYRFSYDDDSISIWSNGSSSKLAEKMRNNDERIDKLSVNKSKTA